MTSPIPASPANVSGFAPAAIPSLVISARPRVIRPALPLSPKPSPSAAPAAIATMFFRAPHSSTPSRSLVDVQPELAAPDPLAIRSASFGSSAATTADAGRPRAISTARFGPDSAATRRGEIPPGVDDHLAHPEQRARLEALDDRQDVRGGARSMAPSAPRSTGVGRRHGEDDEVGVGDGGRIRGDGDGVGELDAGQAARVLAGGIDPGGGLSIMGEEDDGLSSGDQNGKGRAPGARPDDRDPGRAAHRPSRATARRGASRRGLSRGRLAGHLRPARRAAPRQRVADSRSRKTSLIGVPSNPNASRSWFSR